MLKRKQQKAAANQIQPKTICQPLNDAVVQQIFSHLPVRARAKFGEVSKQWNVISRKPALWAACEIAFKSRADRDVKRKKDINSTRHLISLAAFLNKYCTALHDLHLSYDHHDDMASDRLDAFFQIKSLRRMKVLEFSPHEEKQAYIPSKLPACSNLELLNTDLYISVEAAKKLFQGLPNLKELYVPYARISLFNHKDVFSLVKKLERVALKYYSMPPALLVKTCPSLRFIMYYRRWYAKDTDSDTDEEEPIEVIGNTVAVRPEGFEDDSLRENYKLLAPILVPYLHNQPSMSFLAALASNYYFNKEIIKYLVKEKNWDLHYECPAYTYRESFQWHTSSFFSERMKFKFPLDAAIQGYWRDVESVNELMELGAHAECPKEDYSYLTQATRADVRLLLLKHGADPNKMVKVDMNDRNFRVGFGMQSSMIQVPAFVFQFVDAKFEDSEEFVMALKDRVDFNVEVLSKTMLEWALEHKKWNTIYALLKLGVKKISRDWSMAISYALTNGKIDEAKIRQTQLTIKAQQEAEARQRQEIYDRMRKNMAAAPVVQPWVIGSDDESNSSDESDSENRLWWSNSDSDEHGHRSFFKNMSSDESHEPFFEEFSEDNESEVEESEAEEESEESEEANTNVRDQLPAKLQRLYDALVGMQKIIQDLDSFSVKAFQKQLTRDIFPAYISNTKRKQQLKSATDQAESKDLFKALLKQWIDHFLTEFHHEIASMASK